MSRSKRKETSSKPKMTKGKAIVVFAIIMRSRMHNAFRLSREKIAEIRIDSRYPVF